MCPSTLCVEFPIPFFAPDDASLNDVSDPGGLTLGWVDTVEAGGQADLMGFICWVR
jgi:hypothetical protein